MGNSYKKGNVTCTQQYQIHSLPQFSPTMYIRPELPDIDTQTNKNTTTFAINVNPSIEITVSFF